MNQETYSANKWHHVSANGLVTIPGRWELIAIVIGGKGGSSNTATIYDDVEGEETAEQKIAVIDTTAQVGRIELGIPMFKGINVRVATGTAGDLTIIYKKMV